MTAEKCSNQRLDGCLRREKEHTWLCTTGKNPKRCVNTAEKNCTGGETGIEWGGGLETLLTRIVLSSRLMKKKETTKGD